MGGMGPPPKDPKTRQRNNRTATAGTFETSERETTRVPPLGRHPVKRQRWHARTRAWWRELWGSPMRDEYLKADRDGLYALATLIDQFWKSPSPQLAAEIRLQRQCYGLTPIDRRRLQWEIVRTRDAQEKHPPKPRAPELPAGDPRAALRAVS